MKRLVSLLGAAGALLGAAGAACAARAALQRWVDGPEPEPVLPAAVPPPPAGPTGARR